MRFDLFFDFLANGFADFVCFARLVTGERDRGLNDLLLIDNDTERLFENLFEFRMFVLDAFLAVQTADVRADVLHRSGAIERDRRDDMFKLARLHLLKHFTQSRAFNLEHAGHIPAREQVERLRIFDRDVA